MCIRDSLYTIPGSPPNLLHEKPGDAFAPRNRFALNIDEDVYKRQIKRSLPRHSMPKADPFVASVSKKYCLLG